MYKILTLKNLRLRILQINIQNLYSIGDSIYDYTDIPSLESLEIIEVRQFKKKIGLTYHCHDKKLIVSCFSINIFATYIGRVVYLT